MCRLANHCVIFSYVESRRSTAKNVLPIILIILPLMLGKVKVARLAQCKLYNLIIE